MEKNEKYPLKYAAGGTAVIYTKGALGLFKVLRHIEIRAESFLNYLFNPF